ncbi:HEAT repeat domain-containing protein [Tautonia sociabilis]|uniref:HEAT repeat domain-containing protein n=1 Tax=Tautonia sociabilis TaxID=2080755 RepID=A0A432MHI6_9BACT|nr:hypothetical protein [Tautonia sociabilis]RUL86759.1 hypothetical protein TsocGM_15780 [Tautonia sociabilis]
MELGRARSVIVLASALAAGCKSGVRDFAALDDPAAFVRARAAGLDDEVPDAQAIPELIEHLEDPDAVVRLSAHESLRRRTGQDFGYLPYVSAEDRAAAVGRWRAWWEAQTISPSGQWLRPQVPPQTRPRG